MMITSPSSTSKFRSCNESQGWTRYPGRPTLKMAEPAPSSLRMAKPLMDSSGGMAQEYHQA